MSDRLGILATYIIAQLIFFFLMNIMLKQSAGIYSSYSSFQILMKFSTEQRMITTI